MGFYDRFVFPRLLDLAMRNPEVARYRALLVPRARGTVVEIGIGSGLNVPFYGPHVQRLYGLDPAPDVLAIARKRAGCAPFPIDLLAHSAEALPLGDHCADTVVSTFTLCSIFDAHQALCEMKRILKPGGMLLFAEHGLAPDASVQRWQQWLNPHWKKWSGGCNLNRRMDALITAAGFRLAQLETGYARGPKLLSYMYSGEAVAS